MGIEPLRASVQPPWQCGPGCSVLVGYELCLQPGWGWTECGFPPRVELGYRAGCEWQYVLRLDRRRWEAGREEDLGGQEKSPRGDQATHRARPIGLHDVQHPRASGARAHRMDKYRAF